MKRYKDRGTYDRSIGVAAVSAAIATSAKDLYSASQKAVAADLLLVVGADVAVAAAAATTTITSTDVKVGGTNRGSSRGSGGHGEGSEGS